MRMSEGVNKGEWMNERTTSFNFRKSEAHGGMILTGETEGLGEKPVPVSLWPPHITLDWLWREPGPPWWEAGD
jgi:hypothetical protein